MELFEILGLSNTTILTYAAAGIGGAVLLSTAARAMRSVSSGDKLNSRVNRLEMRLAASEDYQPILQMAETLLADMAPNSVAPVTEMFAAANLNRSWFSKSVDPSDIAQRVVDDLQANIVTAAEIARPIQTMNESGAMEVKAQRRRAGQEAKRLAARLNTGTWDRFGVGLLRGGMPSTTVTLLQGFFLQVHALKTAANEQGKGASVDGLMTVLHLSAELIKSAEQNIEEFKRQAE